MYQYPLAYLAARRAGCQSWALPSLTQVNPGNENTFRATGRPALQHGCGFIGRFDSGGSVSSGRKVAVAQRLLRLAPPLDARRYVYAVYGNAILLGDSARDLDVHVSVVRTAQGTGSGWRTGAYKRRAICQTGVTELLRLEPEAGLPAGECYAVVLELDNNTDASHNINAGSAIELFFERIGEPDHLCHREMV